MQDPHGNYAADYSVPKYARCTFILKLYSVNSQKKFCLKVSSAAELLVNDTKL